MGRVSRRRPRIEKVQGVAGEQGLSGRKAPW